MSLTNLLRQRRPQTIGGDRTTPIATDQRHRALELQNTGLALYNQERYTDAVPYLESALNLWTVLGNFQAEQQLFHWLAACYWNLGQVQSSYCCRQEAVTLGRALTKRTAISRSKQALMKLLGATRFTKSTCL